MAATHRLTRLLATTRTALLLAGCTAKPSHPPAPKRPRTPPAASPALEYATATKEGVQVNLVTGLDLPGNKSTHRLSLFVHNLGDGWRIYLLRHQDLADPGKVLGSTRCGEAPWRP